jgi:DNA polymerase III epsilon subunit-like protein
LSARRQWWPTTPVSSPDDRPRSWRVPRRRLELPWIDLAWVLPDLFREVDAGPGRQIDAWLEHFGIASIERHDALSDAFATAQLLQITLAHAARKGFETRPACASWRRRVATCIRAARRAAMADYMVPLRRYYASYTVGFFALRPDAGGARALRHAAALDRLFLPAC